MVYGIISNLDNVNTLEVFKSKRIEEECLVHINYLGKLIEVLKEGDTVYVMSVNRFLTVAQCLAFGKVCMVRGVSFRVMTQPYLDITSSKHWKPSVINQMSKMVCIERSAIGRMSSACKYSNEHWEHLCRTFEMMDLEILAQTFSSDGLMKRGR